MVGLLKGGDRILIFSKQAEGPSPTCNSRPSTHLGRGSVKIDPLQAFVRFAGHDARPSELANEQGVIRRQGDRGVRPRSALG